MGTAQLNSISVIGCNMLVERFQNGEVSVFSEIVNKCQAKVYYLAYRFTRNAEDSLDISQEVFIKVFRSLDKLKEISAFDAWLKRVTINACMDHLRQRYNGQVPFDSILEYEIPHRPPDNSIENIELQKVISKAVDQLPKCQRRVFKLRYNEGLSLKEIAETMDSSLGTVKAHLFRATRRLRKLLAHYIQ